MHPHPNIFEIVILLAKLFGYACYVFCFSLYCAEVATENKIHVDVYAYHLKPPFIVSNRHELGLYYDFSDYLNTKSDKYHFETVFVPRKRIESMLKQTSLDGMLLGVNPIWFNDKVEKKYLWTSNVYHDRDEFVSLAENPVDYNGADSLANIILGGVRGFYYYGIDELVSQGKINRFDTIGEYELLQMLMLKRVDVGIVSRSTLNYLIKAKDWQSKFYTSKQPHDTYQRRILIPHHNKAIYDEVSPIINKLAEDPAWQKILEKY